MNKDRTTLANTQINQSLNSLKLKNERKVFYLAPSIYKNYIPNYVNGGGTNLNTDNHPFQNS